MAVWILPRRHERPQLLLGEHIPPRRLNYEDKRRFPNIFSVFRSNRDKKRKDEINPRERRSLLPNRWEWTNPGSGGSKSTWSVLWRARSVWRRITKWQWSNTGCYHGNMDGTLKPRGTVELKHEPWTTATSWVRGALALFLERPTGKNNCFLPSLKFKESSNKDICPERRLDWDYSPLLDVIIT